MGWRRRVDYPANDLAYRTPSSIPKPTKSALQNHRGQTSKIGLLTKRGAQNMILTATTLNVTQISIVEDLQATLILDAQWPGKAKSF